MKYTLLIRTLRYFRESYSGIPRLSDLNMATYEVVINGERKTLPDVPVPSPQPARKEEVTAWFLKHGDIHLGSAKIYPAKAKPVSNK